MLRDAYQFAALRGLRCWPRRISQGNPNAGDELCVIREDLGQRICVVSVRAIPAKLLSKQALCRRRTVLVEQTVELRPLYLDLVSVKYGLNIRRCSTRST